MIILNYKNKLQNWNMNKEKNISKIVMKWNKSIKNKSYYQKMIKNLMKNKEN